MNDHAYILFDSQKGFVGSIPHCSGDLLTELVPPDLPLEDLCDAVEQLSKYYPLVDTAAGSENDMISSVLTNPPWSQSAKFQISISKIISSSSSHSRTCPEA